MPVFWPRLSITPPIPFLSRPLPPKREAKGELRLLNFLGVPDFAGMSGPEGNLMYGTINEAWRFDHYVFRLHSFYIFLQ